MDERWILREVGLCGRDRCPILIVQELLSGKEVAIPLGLLEACLLGCALHEGGVGTERCTALLAEALRQASGELLKVEIRRELSGSWAGKLTFRRTDGAIRHLTCRPADAATLALAFGVPMDLKGARSPGSLPEEFSPERVAHWLVSLAPEDFLGLSGGQPSQEGPEGPRGQPSP